MNSAPPPSSLSPEWLAHRYDPGHDSIHFIHADRKARRRAMFLTDEHLPGAAEARVVHRRDAMQALAQSPRAPLNFIFHAAYCCSTLLANAYDDPGATFSAKEPVLLNDLVGWRHRGGDPELVGRRLKDSLDLLSRPFALSERGIIKPSNVVNGLAPAMVHLRPEAGVLLLYAPLAAYLGSIASKGLWGRLWVRDLLSKQLLDGVINLGFSDRDYLLQSDLQVAAVGWLTQIGLFADIAARWPQRVRTLDSEALLADPITALAAIDHLFGVSRDADRLDSVIRREFSRNAKSGDNFDATGRREAQKVAAAVHGDEIAKVVEWARVVAEGAGLAMKPPAPLFS